MSLPFLASPFQTQPTSVSRAVGSWSSAFAVSCGLAVFGWVPTALACGGFFCSSSAPVDQTAERIVFSQNTDETITAIIQIDYEGPSERFAWLLPIAGTPEVGISSSSALNDIAQATAPDYRLNTTYEGPCEQPPLPEPEDYGFADAGVFEETSADDSEPEIIVLATGNVGPFDYVVIQPNAALEDKAEVALTWLRENGYDVTSIGPEVLRPYLESGLNLLAFRLTKGHDVGSIRPVMLTYPGTQPSIPLRPTAVAAQNDMGILVWVLGAERSVPENYLSFTLNESRINWFDWQSNYEALVTEAADEAGGQGFLTEFAGASSLLQGRVFDEQAQQDWDYINEGEFTDGFELISLASSYYRFSEGFRDAVGAAVTLPAGVTLDEFGADPDFYRNDPELVIAIDDFRAALFEFVIEPLQRTQTLFDSRPYLTRFYTTMSPAEMQNDPVFTFNPELEDVERLHQADLIVHCSAGQYEWDAPWILRLASGQEFSGLSRSELPAGLEQGPATEQIFQATSSGPPDMVRDNSDAIDETIDELPSVVPSGTTGADASSDDTTESPPDSEEGTSASNTDAEAEGGGDADAGPSRSLKPATVEDEASFCALSFTSRSAYSALPSACFWLLAVFGLALRRRVS